MLKSFYDGSDISMDEYNEDYLEHHGILGMHWGIRRFQPYPEGHKGGKEIGQAAKPRKRKLSKEAKKRAKMRSEAANLKEQVKLDEARAEANRARLAAESSKASIAENKAQSRQKIAEAKYAENTAKLKTGNKKLLKTEKGKKKAILSGDPKKVKRYAAMMSNEEYKAALERCNYANDMHLRDLDRVSKMGKTLSDMLGNFANMARYGISLHDSIATVHNAQSKSGKQWAKWDENKSEKLWNARERKMKEWKFAIETGVNPETGKALRKGDDFWDAYQTKQKKVSEAQVTDFINSFGSDAERDKFLDKFRST